MASFSAQESWKHFDKDEVALIQRLSAHLHQKATRRKVECILRDKSEAKLMQILHQAFFGEVPDSATICETWQKRRALGSLVLLCVTNAAPLAANQLKLLLRTYGVSVLKWLAEHTREKASSSLSKLTRSILLRRCQWDVFENHAAVTSTPDVDFVLQTMRALAIDPFACNAESILRAHRRLVLWLGAGCTLREIAIYEGSHLEDIESNVECAFRFISRSDIGLDSTNISSACAAESDDSLQLQPQQGCFI